MSLLDKTGTLAATITTRFILTQTHHPGNVGAAARAMNVMGFDELWLVQPQDPKVLGRKKCLDGASGAVNVLQQARVVDTLKEAIRGCSVVCGTGMPFDMHQTRQPRLYVEPRLYIANLVLRQQQRQQPAIDSIALVFGNERHGMTEEDMDRCDCMLGIPTNPSFGSLNLASAVQLLAYDWRQALGGFEATMVDVHDDGDTKHPFDGQT
jgi:tRNA/rRNA methyltransferase